MEQTGETEPAGSYIFCFIQLTYSTKIEQEDRRIIVFIYNVPSTLGESRDTPAYHR